MFDKYSKNINTVLSILRDEVRGDVVSALKKMASDYTMTWIYCKKSKQKKDDVLFPRTAPDIHTELQDVYRIKDRKYEIKNVAEGKNVVMIELVESYQSHKRNKRYQTPLVIVLEMKGGKIQTGRHYCDPQLSDMFLTEQQINNLYLNSKTKMVIE